MQPTDPTSLVVFAFREEREGYRRRIDRGTRVRQGLVVRLPMKARIVRIMITLSSVAMIALAGGASLRGF